MSDAADRLVPLLDRARRVLPQDWAFGAVWATHHAGGAYPHFAERAAGARFTDVTGREYLDWFVGGGVSTLGHGHPDVQRAMIDQLERGVHVSLQTSLEVEVAERLCALFPAADQVVYGKNGTDVTSAAVRLARAVTGREHVLVSGYHGWQDWSKAVDAAVPGIPQALRGLVHEFPFQRLEAARELLGRLRDRVAAIVVEPVRWDVPAPGFLPGLRALADEHGCLLVFDEIVTGLRVARGGAQQMAGVAPDLTCLAKSLANGLPLAALIGRRRFLKHLPPAFFALTYQREALSLAAARAALDVHATVDVCGHLADLGEGLRKGFAAAAARHGLPWALQGHPAMLHLHVAGTGRLGARGAMAMFVEAVQRRGVYVAPFRLLPSLAHTADDVARTVRVFDEAMAEVRVAAEHGLAGRLDSPIWNGFEEGPPSRRRGELRRQPLPPAGGTTFVVEGTDDVAEHGCEVASRLAGDFTVRARFRVRLVRAENAVVTVTLGLMGFAWRAVSYVAAVGQTPRLRGNVGAAHSAPDRAGREAVELVLVRNGGRLAAWATGDAGEPDAALGEVADAAEVRSVAFRVQVEGGRDRRVEVELAELAVTGDGGP